MLNIKTAVDVIVVGAGPAGSICACECAKNGFSVLLIEKTAKVGKSNICGGLLTASVLQNFFIPSRIISRVILGYKIYSPSGQQILMPFSNPGATVERKNFDYFLAKEAENSGVELITSCKVLGVEQDSDSSTVNCSLGNIKKTFKADVVVIANGPKSNLVEGVIPGFYNGLKFVVAMQQHYPLFKNQSYPFFEAFHDAYLGYGLGWFSPMGNHAIIGIGILLSEVRELKKRFMHFTARKEFLSKVDLSKILKTESALIPFDNFPKKLYSDRILIVGDAGMLCNPFSGDGIYYAMMSGKYAAQTIATAFELNDFSKKGLHMYQVMLEKNFRAQFSVCNSMQKQIYSSPTFAERSLTTADKNFVDFIEKIIWSKTLKKLTLRMKLALLINLIKNKS